MAANGHTVVYGVFLQLYGGSQFCKLYSSVDQQPIQCKPGRCLDCITGDHYRRSNHLPQESSTVQVFAPPVVSGDDTHLGLCLGPSDNRTAFRSSWSVLLFPSFDLPCSASPTAPFWVSVCACISCYPVLLLINPHLLNHSF